MRKLVNYRRPDGAPSWGVVTDGIIHDLATTGGPQTLDEAIRMDRIPDAQAAQGGPTIDFDRAALLPVVMNPGKIICVGLNYRSHRDEIGKPPPDAPVIFPRYADSQIAHREPAIKPSFSDFFDYEGEMAVVIGKPAFRVEAGDAESHVLGYSVYNDFTVRDWQRASSQWLPGKTFPGTGGFGPWLVPAADIPDVNTLTLETRVNGEVRQRASLADLIFPIPELISYISTFTPLNPGDVIVSGTPGGVGFFMEPQGLLSDGDTVEVEVDGIGVLQNTVKEV